MEVVCIGERKLSGANEWLGSKRTGAGNEDYGLFSRMLNETFILSQRKVFVGKPR